MSDLKYLNLLAKQFPNASSAKAEIIRLRAINELPKGTEYFFSDLHGEDKGFIHLLRSASGNIRKKISELYQYELTQDAQNQLANLVYDPKRVLSILKESGRITDDWLAITIYRLVNLSKFISVKYSWHSTSSKIPEEFEVIITELLFSSYDESKKNYLNSIIRFIIEEETAFAFIGALCEMIQNISVNTLHVIGDIYDRGPGPDRIMEELIDFPDVDIQWGNHDIVWMGAAAGNTACMAHVIRIGIGYNTFDFMEEGYGINLRPLSTFAAKVYADDPCERFKTRLFDKPEFGFIDEQQSAKMHKAISVIQFKLEGQLIDRYPRWNMDHRNVLKKVDFERGVYVHDGVDYPLLDTNFPTIDPDDPLRLTDEEEELVRSLEVSFRNSEPLHRHIRFLYSNGSTYLSVNKNLLFHGCVPLKDDGSFQEVPVTGKYYYGRELFDELNAVIHDAYFQPEGSPERVRARDYMLYLWCGSLSPLFGKSQMSTFENFFVDDKELRREVYNPYFEHSAHENTCKMILENFGLDPEIARIINGHVPVKAKEGESPVKANGKLFVIDGGLAKAYQKRTGINGYTLIFNSHHLALAEHHDFETIESDMGSYTPRVFIVQPMQHRLQEKHTDLGKEISARIQELRDLIEAFKRGEIKEK
ncbi:MAG: fructose-1,6-bisphosphatase [Clostridiaceae bacterium]|nr:fructose-1,6-bisphosphatase [Clostridiaceae bacterium]